MCIPLSTSLHPSPQFTSTSPTTPPGRVQWIKIVPLGSRSTIASMSTGEGRGNSEAATKHVRKAFPGPPTLSFWHVDLTLRRLYLLLPPHSLHYKGIVAVRQQVVQCGSGDGRRELMMQCGLCLMTGVHQLKGLQQTGITLNLKGTPKLFTRDKPCTTTLKDKPISVRGEVNRSN